MKKSLPFSFSRSDYVPRRFVSVKLPRAVPALRFLVPHKVRRKWRATRSRIHSGVAPASSLTTLNLSFSPADTIKALSQHQWSLYDAQYLLLLLSGIFDLCIAESPGPMMKMGLATLIMLSLVLPITRQFFLPTLPILGWLFLFYSCKFIPSEYRPDIWVRVLPALENIFYGANLSNILQAHKHWILDVLAWLPYGIMHFGAPVVCSAVMFIWAPPKYLPVFARTFGYMNMIGVIIQLLFPCSPPWYENMYGLAPANYSIPGSPAGLARVDELFGLGFYTTTFTASPLVFGAFPSLHSGNGTLEALFMSNVFPKLTPLFIMYVMWLWWSTMYLSHHYAVDLVGGSLLAGICFFIAKSKFLPRMQWDKELRWDYDYIEIGDGPETDYVPKTGLAYEEFHPLSDSDEWTLGTSSSFSSRSRSPSSGTRSSSDNMWEGDTLASGSGSDVERGKGL